MKRPKFGRLDFILLNSRKTLLGGIAIVISIIGLAVVAICIAILSASSNFSDRLAEIGDVISGATLVLAIVAAVVALLAYAASTGLPDLRLQVDFPFSELNNPSFQGAVQEHGVIEAGDFKQLLCTVRVSNDSNYSAKNPAIVIRLNDMAFSPDVKRANESGWAVIQFATTFGVTVIQWDGGSDYSIYGKSIRTLPALPLSRLHTSSYPDPYMDIDILAEGYHRRVTIPVRFTTDVPSTSSGKYAHIRTSWI